MAGATSVCSVVVAPMLGLGKAGRGYAEAPREYAPLAAAQRLRSFARAGGFPPVVARVPVSAGSLLPGLVAASHGLLESAVWHRPVAPPRHRPIECVRPWTRAIGAVTPACSGATRSLCRLAQWPHLDARRSSGRRLVRPAMDYPRRWLWLVRSPAATAAVLTAPHLDDARS
ncbi:hypothetical protein D3C76_1233770 [compost metagenome]